MCSFLKVENPKLKQGWLSPCNLKCICIITSMLALKVTLVNVMYKTMWLEILLDMFLCKIEISPFCKRCMDSVSRTV